MSTNIADAMIAEYAHESAGTRKMLERIPEDKLSWKPHEKSMTLGRLAGHLAEIPEWTQTIVNDRVFDMDAADYKPKEYSSKQEILEDFDKNVEQFQSLLRGKTDQELAETWQMKQGGKVVLEMPRMACLRGFIMSHTIHHRGQFSVYLRENDVPLPAIYGPSADEQM